MDLDLFSLTKLTAATVVVWWGVQDRQTRNQGGIPVAELGMRDTSPTVPEPDIRAHVHTQLTLELAGFSPILVNPALLHHRRQAMSWGRGPRAEINHKFLEML